MLRAIFSFLASTRVVEVSWLLFIWSVTGVLAGFLVGMGAFLAIRSGGGYRLTGKGGRWWRALVCVLNIAASGLAFGYIGVCEGAGRSLREVLTESPLVTRLTGSLGKVEAIFLAGAYYAATGVRNNPRITPGDEARVIAAGVDAFVSGSQEIDVRDLHWQLESIGGEVVAQAMDVVEQKTVALVPLFEEPRSRAVLGRVLEGLGQVLAKEPAREGLRRLRLDAYFDRLLADLPRAAARSGTPEGITFQEMSDQLGRTSLVDWVLEATGSFLRGQQFFALAVLAVVLGVPVLLFWLTRKLMAAPGKSGEGGESMGSFTR